MKRFLLSIVVILWCGISFCAEIPDSLHGHWMTVSNRERIHMFIGPNRLTTIHQADGLTYTVIFSEVREEKNNITMFGKVSGKKDTRYTFKNVRPGNDFRLSFRTVLNSKFDIESPYATFRYIDDDQGFQEPEKDWEFKIAIGTGRTVEIAREMAMSVYRQEKARYRQTEIGHTTTSGKVGGPFIYIMHFKGKP